MSNMIWGPISASTCTGTVAPTIAKKIRRLSGLVLRDADAYLFEAISRSRGLLQHTGTRRVYDIGIRAAPSIASITFLRASATPIPRCQIGVAVFK